MQNAETQFDITTISIDFTLITKEKQKTGYAFEVDLLYTDFAWYKLFFRFARKKWNSLFLNFSVL